MLIPNEYYSRLLIYLPRLYMDQDYTVYCLSCVASTVSTVQTPCGDSPVLPVAVSTSSHYTRRMTDNIIPFENDAYEADPAGGTRHATDTQLNDVNDDVKKLVQVRDRYRAIVTLIDHVNRMIEDWASGEESYTMDDIGVVERMCTSMEDALYLSIGEDPDEQRDT